MKKSPPRLHRKHRADVLGKLQFEGQALRNWSTIFVSLTLQALPFLAGELHRGRQRAGHGILPLRRPAGRMPIIALPSYFGPGVLVGSFRRTANCQLSGVCSKHVGHLT